MGPSLDSTGWTIRRAAHRVPCMQAIAGALLGGECFSSDAAAAVAAATGGEFGVIEGCERDDFSFGDALGVTDGSSAEGVRSWPYLPMSLPMSLPPSCLACENFALTYRGVPRPGPCCRFHFLSSPPVPVSKRSCPCLLQCSLLLEDLGKQTNSSHWVQGSQMLLNE